MKLEMNESMNTTPGLLGSEAASGRSGAKYLGQPSTGYDTMIRLRLASDTAQCAGLSNQHYYAS